MATTTSDKVLIELQAKMDAFTRDVLAATRGYENSMATIAKSSLRAEAQALRSSTAIRNAFSAVGGAAVVRQIAQMADAWTDYSSRVGLAVKDMEAAPEVMERIYDMAQRTYSSLDQTAEAFLSNATALRELGYNTNEQLDYTEALNNALVVSGAKAQRAESVTIALSKAMALGTLQGDNLNTVIETGGRVAEALAEELGVGVNQLRGLGKEGKITGDIVYNSLTKRLQDLRDEAESMPATIADGFQQVRNALQRYIGSMDHASGVTATIAQGLVYTADNLGSVANAAAAAAAIMLSQYVPALGRVVLAQARVVATNPFLLLVTAIAGATYALSAFGAEIHPIEGSMANLQDYAGAAFDVIKDGVSTASEFITGSLLTAINLIVSALSDTEITWQDVGEAVKNAANVMIGAMTFVYDTIVIAFTKLPQAIADGVISAMNRMIELVESGLHKIVEGVNSAIRALNRLGSYVGAGDLISELDPGQLNRITNSYEGAGKEAGDAYAKAFERASQDHLGKLAAAWTKSAESKALSRAIMNTENSRRRAAQGEGSGGGGGGGGGGAAAKKGRQERQNALEREIQKIRERTNAINAETEAQRQINPLIDDYDYAITKAGVAQDLLNAAAKAGIADTPELRAQIEGLAESYARATVESNKLAETQEQMRQASEFLRGALYDAFAGIIPAIETGNQVLDKFLNTLMEAVFQATLLGKGPLAGLFGGGGGLLSLFGFARGGIAAGGSPQPMQTFARGGISRKAAIFGEAGPEAAVPLPDGRRIPVDLRSPDGLNSGESGGSVDVRVTIEDGNLKGYIEKTSGRVAAQVYEAGAPGLVKTSVGSVQKRIRDNPSFSR